MNDSEREWLINSLRKLLLPALEQAGFEIIPLAGDDARSAHIRRSFPFGRLRRRNGLDFEMVEIQLDKNGRAAFRLNIGIAPAGGISHRVGQVAQEDVWIHYLSRYFSVYQFPITRRWFAILHWPGRSIKEYDIEELVGGVVKILPEIERALGKGKCGFHIKRIGK